MASTGRSSAPPSAPKPGTRLPSRSSPTRQRSIQTRASAFSGGPGHVGPHLSTLPYLVGQPCPLRGGTVVSRRIARGRAVVGPLRPFIGQPSQGSRPACQRDHVPTSLQISSTRPFFSQPKGRQGRAAGGVFLHCKYPLCRHEKRQWIAGVELNEAGGTARRSPCRQTSGSVVYQRKCWRQQLIYRSFAQFRSSGRRTRRVAYGLATCPPLAFLRARPGTLNSQSTKTQLDTLVARSELLLNQAVRSIPATARALFSCVAVSMTQESPGPALGSSAHVGAHGASEGAHGVFRVPPPLSEDHVYLSLGGVDW